MLTNFNYARKHRVDYGAIVSADLTTQIAASSHLTGIKSQIKDVTLVSPNVFDVTVALNAPANPGTTITPIANPATLLANLVTDFSAGTYTYTLKRYSVADGKLHATFNVVPDTIVVIDYGKGYSTGS